MQKLIDGYLRFRAEVFPQWKDHFHLLAESQSPEVLFITCSDSRIVPNLIFQSEPGDMFLCRNAGNVVPPAGERAGGVSATIEYAVEVLRVAHVILCGHSDCGAVRAARQPELSRNLPLVQPWLHYVQEAQRRGETLLHATKGEPASDLRHEVCANVVGQLLHLRTQPAVARGLAAGSLRVHGWYYDILTGAVEVYVPGQRRFLALEQWTPDAS
ncbi:MAG TPA: carbonic anhydrase [Acidobacteriaceae bacterium]